MRQTSASIHAQREGENFSLSLFLSLYFSNTCLSRTFRCWAGESTKCNVHMNEVRKTNTYAKWHRTGFFCVVESDWQTDVRQVKYIIDGEKQGEAFSSTPFTEPRRTLYWIWKREKKGRKIFSLQAQRPMMAMSAVPRYRATKYKIFTGILRAKNS